MTTSDQGAIGLVNSKFTDASAYAATAFAEAQTLLAQLSGLRTQINFPDVDTSITPFPYTSKTSTFNYTEPDITLPSCVVTPAQFEGISTPDFDTSNFIVPSQDVPEVAKVVDPKPITNPDVPVFQGSTSLLFDDFNATDTINACQSILKSLQANLTTVGNLILGFLTHPTPAMGTAVVNAMTGTMLQSLDDDYQNKYNEVNNYFSSRGWNVPQGPMLGRMGELDRAHTMQRAYVQRDVLLKNFELSQQNFIASLQMYIQFTHENNVTVMAILNMMFEAIKFSFETTVMKFNAFVALYKTQVEIFTFELDTQIKEVKLTIDMNRALIDQSVAQIQGYSAQIGAITSYNQSLESRVRANTAIYSAQIQGITERNSNAARSYAAEVQHYSAEVQLAVAQADVNIKKSANAIAVFDAEVRQDIAGGQIAVQNSGIAVDAKKAQVSLTVEKIEADIKNMIAITSLNAEIAKASATIAAQLCASSLSAVSAGANVSFHENLSYDETKDVVSTQINLSGSV